MSDLEDSYQQVLKGIEPELVWQRGEVTVSRLTSNMWQIDTNDDDESLAAAFEYLSSKRLIPEHFDKWWSDKYTDDRIKMTILMREVDDEATETTTEGRDGYESY